MKILIISGSGRKESQSLKVANFIARAFGRLDQMIAVEVLDLHQANIPIDYDAPEEGGEWYQNWLAISKQLSAADGYVLVSPEWNGMAAPAIKNMFAHIEKEVADKPALLVGVSNGRGGGYPLTELRASSYKNCRICYIPEYLIIRNCEGVLNHDEERPESTDDMYLKQRIPYALKVLVEYTKALQSVRSSNATDYKTYANGM